MDQSNIVQSIVDEAKRAAAEDFDELYPCQPDQVDQAYLLRRKATVISNATVALVEYDGHLNQAIVENMIEMMQDDLHLNLGEEYGSIREWAHSKLENVASQRTINRWLRVAMAMQQAYLEGATADPIDLYRQVGVTKAEVLATAQDILNDPSTRDQKMQEIIDSPSTEKAKQVLEDSTIDKEKPVLVVREQADGSTKVYGIMTHEQAMEFMVSASQYIDFRMDA